MLFSPFFFPSALLMVNVQRYVQSLAPQVRGLNSISLVITKVLYFRFLTIVFVCLLMRQIQKVHTIVEGEKEKKETIIYYLQFTRH